MEAPVEKNFPSFRAWKAARSKWDYAQRKRKAADANPPPLLAPLPPAAPPSPAALPPTNASRGAPRQRPTLEPTFTTSPGGCKTCKLVHSPGGTVYDRAVTYHLWPERAYEDQDRRDAPHSRENAMDRNRHAEASALKQLRASPSEAEPAERKARQEKQVCSIVLRNLLADSAWSLDRTETFRLVEMARDGLRAFLDSDEDDDRLTSADARHTNIEKFRKTTAVPRMVEIGTRYLLQVIPNHTPNPSPNPSPNPRPVLNLKVKERGNEPNLKLVERL